MIAKMMVGVGKPAGQAVWLEDECAATQGDGSGKVDLGNG